jgi:predicted chitinase
MTYGKLGKVRKEYSRSIDIGTMPEASNPDEVSDNEELYILSAIWHWDSHCGNDAAESNSCDCCECKAIDPDPYCVGTVRKTVNGGCNNAKHRNDAFNRILKKQVI